MLVSPMPDPSERYVHSPSVPQEPGATRNLVWGIVLLSLAAIGFWMGLYYAGAAAARTLVACLLTFGVIWLLLNLNVLRQRHGALFGLGIVAFIGTAIPWVEGGFRRLDGFARERLAGETLSPAAYTVPPPPVTSATAPPAPPTIPLPGEDSQFAAVDVSTDSAAPGRAGKTSQAAPTKSKAERAGAETEPPKTPLATKPGPDGVRELIVPEPPEGAGKLIRVKEDVKVDLGGRPTIIRGGTVAPFKELNDGLVTFLAGDHEVSIAMELVMFTGTSKEKPEDITKLAQQEVMRRYPKLKEPDSRENILFVTRVKELQLDPEMKLVFFEDPKWPLVLAEQLAQQENWSRGDLPPDEGAAAAPSTETTDAPPANIPANELPADKDLLLPGNLPPIPQQAEPPPAK